MDKKEVTRKKILDAALDEFAKNGYKLASTNTIYQQAKVSKGTIFLYFKSKAELYYEVFYQALMEMMMEYQKNDFDKIPDIFDKITSISFWKLEYFAKHEKVGKIMIEVISNPPSEVNDKMSLILTKLSSDTPLMLFENLDMSRFSKEYTKEEVITYFTMALDGLRKSILSKDLSLEYFKCIKDQSLQFLKIVLKGMEK